MSTVIGATGADLLLPVPDRDTPAALVLGAPADQSLDDALETAWSALQAVGHLVVVVPAALSAAHRGRLRAVRSLLESDRMALVDIDLPPLATALLVEQLRRISPYDLGPGVIASAARLLAHYLHAGAVLGSVAKLDRVDVGLGTHLKSLLPGARFAVQAAPAASLTQLADDTRLPGPDYATGLAWAAPAGHSGRGHAAGHPPAGPGLGEEWVKDRLAADWKCQYVRQVPLPEGSARWWGTAKVVEFAAYIADVGVLYQLVGSAHRAPCRWCGLELVGDRCAFCSSPLTTAAPAPAPAGNPPRRHGG
ncbi:hypothetical protein POF50_011990 [Streptomyces sp. SL13]|uniref:Uncharacterized protein n=1 Tax=Streptantibioticus silvisoli TaxID=2705255 RepID=A0AA90H493_9ACTN|nr:hypothetical protein [Streptantibioticus silvisoli]MDI5970052.1 hypothetical protein [Streptantibioticus silvisoli]